jgi:far upstream element-binding protein
MSTEEVTGVKHGLENSEEPAAKKQRAEGLEDMITLRVLIDGPEKSIVIGRAGCNVKAIRAQTSAFISVLRDAHPSAREKIAQVKGHVSNVADACKMICEILLTAAGERAAKHTPPTDAPKTWTLKIIFHKFLAGCIIGKGGEIIKKIAAESGARLHLEQEPYPGTTDKLCTISGTPDQIHAAMLTIAQQLQENPLKSGAVDVPYTPGMGAQAAPAFGAQAPGQYNPYGAPPQGFGGYGAQSAMGGAPAGAPGAAGDDRERKIEKIVIPTVCAGFVIGKAGSFIKQIREQSGVANLSIADAEPTTPDDRVVVITGTVTQITAAIALIRQRVESYRPPGAAPVAPAQQRQQAYGAQQGFPQMGQLPVQQQYGMQQQQYGYPPAGYPPMQAQAQAPQFAQQQQQQYGATQGGVVPSYSPYGAQ